MELLDLLVKASVNECSELLVLAGIIRLTPPSLVLGSLSILIRIGLTLEALGFVLDSAALVRAMGSFAMDLAAFVVFTAVLRCAKARCSQNTR